MAKKHVAVDLGAESGRVIVGDVGAIEVVHRFPNLPVKVGASLLWDVLAILSEVKRGLRIAFERYPHEIASIGIDTWGVDYGLVDSAGQLIGSPYHYRDARTDGVPDELFRRVPREEVYRATGIQIMQINTLYQITAFAKSNPDLYRASSHLLFMPDLFNYWLTGIMRNEYTIATTSQLFDSQARRWALDLIRRLRLESKLFGEVVMPGTVLGHLTPSVAAEIGADADVVVVAPASHDTGSAVAAVPAGRDSDFAYLSSGTWSLLGIESREPIISEKSFRYNFTNEGSADGGIRLLKNIMGLWIVQECKRTWDAEGKPYTYAELTEMAEKNGPANFSIDPDDARYLKPSITSDSMPERIRSWCRESRQNPPREPGLVVRGVLESLAKTYARTIDMARDISGRAIRELYIIGGGSQNDLLCRLAADATGIPVMAGPVEATAIGNIMVQQIALGTIGSIGEGRALVREAYDIKRYEPTPEKR